MLRNLAALVLATALAGYGSAAARADTVQPFLVCSDLGAVMAIADAYREHARLLDAIERLSVAERCFRAPPWQAFEVAEVVAGPFTDYEGRRLYVVRIDAGDGRSLYTWTWRRLKAMTRGS